jgi:hypothetical protein
LVIFSVMTSILTQIETWLREVPVAVAVTIVALITVGIVFPVAWNYVFAAAIAWVVSDVVINLIVKGGGRIVQIPILGTRTQFKGHGYLAFMIGILVGTSSSTFLSENLLGIVGITLASAQAGRLVLSGADWTSTVLIASVLAGLLVYGDFQFRFYVRD